MSQLTKEQYKILMDKLPSLLNSTPVGVGLVLDAINEALKPLPSYGEVFQSERNSVSKGGCCHWYELEGQNIKEWIEAGAQEVRRVVYEREIVPGIENVIEKLDVVCLASIESVVLDLRGLIKEFV